MKKTNKRRLSIAQYFIIIIMAISIAVVMTILTIVPPFSIFYNWLAENDATLVWSGLTGGIIGGCGAYYYIKKKRQK